MEIQLALKMLVITIAIILPALWKRLIPFGWSLGLADPAVAAAKAAAAAVELDLTHPTHMT